MTTLTRDTCLIAAAAALLVAATLATLLLYGEPTGHALIRLGDRFVRAGGGDPLLTVEAVEAIATVTCEDVAARYVARPVTVGRK